MNITLVGMPGVGKSIIGRELAKKLNYRFLDIDEIIEKRTKLKLQKILDDFGDDKFLEIEEKTILELNKFNNYIISPGGSVVYSQRAMKFLKKKSIIIFLDISFKLIKEYLLNLSKSLSKRGIVGLKNKGLETLFKERLPLYKKYADITVKITEDFNINTIIKNIYDKVLLSKRENYSSK